MKECCFSGLITSSMAFPSVELVVDVEKTLLGFLLDMKSSSSDVGVDHMLLWYRLAGSIRLDLVLDEEGAVRRR